MGSPSRPHWVLHQLPFDFAKIGDFPAGQNPESDAKSLLQLREPANFRFQPPEEADRPPQILVIHSAGAPQPPENGLNATAHSRVPKRALDSCAHSQAPKHAPGRGSVIPRGRRGSITQKGKRRQERRHVSAGSAELRRSRAREHDPGRKARGHDPGRRSQKRRQARERRQRSAS